MRSLPPLNPIKAFEASARLGSFVDAADELGVSSAAVSLQVKKAEEFFGKLLFVRQNNSIILTDAGHMLFLPVSKSLSELARATEVLMENEVKAQFVVSTIQSIADTWVAPALAALRQKFPSVGIQILLEDDPVDLIQNRVDVRLTYGGQHYAKNDSVIIATDRVLPYCTPRFAEEHQSSIENVADGFLIHINWGPTYSSYPSWSSWFEAARIARIPDLRKGIVVAGTAVAATIAENSGGVVLIPEGLAIKQVRSDALVPIHKTHLRLPFDFNAVQNPKIETYGGPGSRKQLITEFLQEINSAAIKSESRPTTF